MLRKEQFAFGTGLVASALAFILSKTLAWFVLLIGCGLVADFYIRDFIWGADRPSKQEIAAMPPEEYKKRVLRNPKTRQWTDWLLSGREAFKKRMRKLAREATIFMLIGFPLTAFSLFGYWRYEQVKNLRVQRAAVSEIKLDPSTFVPLDLPANYKPSPLYLDVNDNEDLALDAAQSGLQYGFLCGFGFWVFYRVLRFAVKG